MVTRRRLSHLTLVLALLGTLALASSSVTRPAGADYPPTTTTAPSNDPTTYTSPSSPIPTSPGLSEVFTITVFDPASSVEVLVDGVDTGISLPVDANGDLVLTLVWTDAGVSINGRAPIAVPCGIDSITLRGFIHGVLVDRTAYFRYERPACLATRGGGATVIGSVVPNTSVGATTSTTTGAGSPSTTTFIASTEVFNSPAIWGVILVGAAILGGLLIGWRRRVELSRQALARARDPLELVPDDTPPTS